MDIKIPYLIVIFCILMSYISVLMIARYLWKHNLLPKWKLITGLMFASTFYSAYIRDTREEYGHIGIWFKLFILSLFLIMITAILTAIFF